MNSAINNRVLQIKEKLTQNHAKSKELSSWMKIDISRNPNEASHTESWDNTWDKGPWNNFHNYVFNNWGN